MYGQCSCYLSQCWWCSLELYGPLPATPFAKGFISPSSYNIKANERIKCREGGRGKWNGELTAVGWWGGGVKWHKRKQQNAKQKPRSQSHARMKANVTHDIGTNCVGTAAQSMQSERTLAGSISIHPSI